MLNKKWKLNFDTSTNVVKMAGNNFHAGKIYMLFVVCFFFKIDFFQKFRNTNRTECFVRPDLGPNRLQ